MTLESWDYIELFLDVIALCLCGTAIIWLIRKRTEFVEMTENTRRTDDAQDFGSLLAKSMESDNSHEPRPVAVLTESGCEAADTDEKYGEVIRLADKGLGSGEISKRVDIPKGEIDLVVKLNRENELYGKK